MGDSDMTSDTDTLPLLDFTIEKLGKCSVESPLKAYLGGELGTHSFVSGRDKTIYDPRLDAVKGIFTESGEPPAMEIAGPRQTLYFDPSTVKAAIVTCGGLCPGVNDVIRALFMALNYRYRVKEIIGIRYGFSGLVPRIGRPPIVITPQHVEGIHRSGGTLLGSSRGPQDPKEMVDFLERERINVLFAIGGDGTQRAALSIAEEVERRKCKISIIGIPKTIDNDIAFIERSFGYKTAVGIARDVLESGHEEARGAYNGVSVVKLMGRNSGFIAAMAAVANGDANFVLVPEVPFDLHGRNGFLACLEKRLNERHHALVVVAEGAGQELIPHGKDDAESDASGNKRLKDIGPFLVDEITKAFGSGWNATTVKYIDPSYVIRSSPANSDDNIFCAQLAHNAVHAAMSGRTKMVMGLWNNTFTHVPMELLIHERKRLDPHGHRWLSVLETTGQPASMKN